MDAYLQPLILYCFYKDGMKPVVADKQPCY